MKFAGKSGNLQENPVFCGKFWIGYGESCSLLAGAVAVAPEALGPARAGSGPASGLTRRWRAQECTLATERNRPPPHARGVGGLPGSRARAAEGPSDVLTGDGAGDAQVVRPLLVRGAAAMSRAF